jgi:divalent metal cation (Fe/Co/Zn/Cd) transporter
VSRRAATPTLDPTVVVYAVPLTPNEMQLVARAVRLLIAKEGVSVAGQNVLAMLDRPLDEEELRSLGDVLV